MMNTLIISTKYLVTGPLLQAIYLALMKMMQKVENAWKTFFLPCSQHYLIHCYCVLRFVHVYLHFSNMGMD